MTNLETRRREAEASEPADHEPDPLRGLRFLLGVIVGLGVGVWLIVWSVM